MPLKGVQPNTISFNACISACAKVGEWRAALALLQRMQQRDDHDRVARRDARGRGRGDARLQARSADGSAAPPPNTISYNAALAACARGGAWREALELLRQMAGEADGTRRRDRRRRVARGVVPDAVTYNTALDAFARGRQWRMALGLLRSMGRRRAIDPIGVCTVAIACELAGSWRGGLAALLCYLSMVRRESVLDSIGAHGLDAESADADRFAECFRPDSVDGGPPHTVAVCAPLPAALAPAFGAVARCCASAGQEEEAKAIVEAANAHIEGGLPIQLVHRGTGGTVSGTDGSGLTGSRLSQSARAEFVLEGAQVSCAHGENATSAADIFLTLPRPGAKAADDIEDAPAYADSERRMGTINIALESRALVHRMRRPPPADVRATAAAPLRSAYVPVLQCAPESNAKGERLSSSRRRRLLAHHAEKKALAGQLRLGCALWLLCCACTPGATFGSTCLQP
jgi:pentatricopeptide repeat protein